MSTYSCSNLSLDSLECENVDSFKFKSATKLNQVKCDKIVPYYSGDVFIGDVEHLCLVRTPPRVQSNCKIPMKTVPSKSHMSLGTGSEGRSGGPQSFRPTFACYIDKSRSCKGAKIVQRISRRTIFPEKHEIIPRHKSVSYLEQFKKRIFDSQKLQTSVISIADLEPYQSPSMESWSNKDSGVETSELDFCEDIMFQPQSTKIDLNSCKSTIEADKKSLANYTKSFKNKKEKTVILEKIPVGVPKIPGSKEVEKKSSVERREAYANKVKLRNEFNFSRQKEMDRMNKCIKKEKYPDDLKPQDRKAVEKRSENASAIPFICSFPVLSKETKTRQTRKHSKIRKENQGLKVPLQEDNMKIEMLRKRHEQEKQLVNSLRHLIIKN